jgi:hypothetical protein
LQPRRWLGTEIIAQLRLRPTTLESLMKKLGIVRKR